MPGKHRMKRATLGGISLLGGVLWSCIGPPTGDWPDGSHQNRVTPPEGAAPVNLQIDAEREDVQGLKNIVDELLRRGIRTTIYVTGDYANRNALLVQELYEADFEIALHGYHTGEQLASMTYEEQKDLLTRARMALEGCQPCGTYKPIVGFRPQYFSQNEDTYRVLDELGFTYDSGFKAGQIHLDGHQEDAAPYRAAGRGFHAVPVSTIGRASEGVYLCDIACANVHGMTPEEWLEVLRQGFRQAQQRDAPMVALFHGWYTGDRDQYDYWQSFTAFLDEVQDQAAFVTTEELVEMYSD